MNDVVPASEPKTMSRSAVVSLGVCALIVGFLFAPLFPFVVTVVCGWWLYDDLARDPSKRPGWLGLLGLGVFVVVAVLSTTLVLTADASSDCGAALMDMDRPEFDRECFDARLWRPVVGGMSTLLIGGFGYLGVRRSMSDQSPVMVSVRTAGVMAAVVVATVVLLVQS